MCFGVENWLGRAEVVRSKVVTASCRQLVAGHVRPRSWAKKNRENRILGGIRRRSGASGHFLHGRGWTKG